MNALVGFIALVVVAIVGWAIAEFKYKAFTFTRSEKDLEATMPTGIIMTKHGT